MSELPKYVQNLSLNLLEAIRYSSEEDISKVREWLVAAAKSAIDLEMSMHLRRPKLEGGEK